MFEVRDVNGDGKSEIVTRKRTGSGTEWRETLTVLAMGAGDAPFVMFQHEVGIHGPAGTVPNEVRFGQEGGRPSIEISPGNAVGYSAATYREAVETSMDPLLFPLGDIKSQVYEWNGKAFTKAREEKQAPGSAPSAMSQPAAARAARPMSLAPVGAPSHGRRDTRPSARALQAAIGTWSAQRSPASTSRSISAEDGHKERMLLHGRDLVVFGKAFKGGRATRSSRSSSSPTRATSSTSRHATSPTTARPRFSCAASARVVPQRGRAEAGHGGSRGDARLLGRRRAGIARLSASKLGARWAASAYKARSRCSLGRVVSISRCDRGAPSASAKRRIRSAKTKEEGGLEPALALGRRAPRGTTGTARLSFGDERRGFGARVEQRPSAGWSLRGAGTALRPLNVESEGRLAS